MLITSVISQRHYRNLEWLYTHLIIRQFAVSMFSIFSSIYIYDTLIQSGFQSQTALGLTTLFLSLLYFCHFCSIRLAIKFINKFGLRRSMLAGGMFITLFSLTLYLAKYNLLWLACSAILSGLYLALYFTAFHIYFTELTDDKKQGEEIALGGILPSIASIIGPIFAGLVIKLVGFGGVFLTMGIALAIANIPLKFIPNTKDEIKIEVKNLFTFFKSKQHTKNNIALGSFAITDIIAGYFWPLFVFPILADGFVSLGFLGSFISFVSTIAVFLIGYLIDKFGPKILMKITSILDSILWVSRIFVTTYLQVFISSGLQTLTNQGKGISLDTMVYKKSRGQNNIVPILQREVTFSITKSSFLFVMGLLFLIGLPLISSFAVAAFTTLLSQLYKEKD